MMDAPLPPVQQIAHCVEVAQVSNIEDKRTIFVAGTEIGLAQLQVFIARYPDWSVKVLPPKPEKIVAAISSSQTTPWREVAAIIYKAQQLGMEVSFVCAPDTGESK